VKFDWSQDVPLYVRAMVLADKSLFVCGPPDLVDDEVSLEKIMARDTKVQEQLAEQDAALLGSQGAPLMIVSTESGEARLVKQLKHLPVWDGMVAGNGKLFIATTAGTVICLGGEKK
jgi:hypothetical protein